MNILCRLGIHSWRFTEKYEPSLLPWIIAHVEFASICTRCGRVEKTVMKFDDVTGAPIGEPINTVTA